VRSSFEGTSKFNASLADAKLAAGTFLAHRVVFGCGVVPRFPLRELEHQLEIVDGFETIMIFLGPIHHVGRILPSQHIDLFVV